VGGQRQAAPPQGPGSAQAGGRARGLREPAATEQGGQLWRSHGGSLGLPALDGLPVQGLAEDPREACVGPEGGEPVPGAPAGASDDEPLAIRRNDVQAGLRGGWHVTMSQNLAARGEEAARQGARLQGAAAVKWGLGGVESPEVSSSFESDFAHYQPPTRGCWGGGLNKYHRTGADALQPPLRSGFRARLTASVRLFISCAV